MFSLQDVDQAAIELLGRRLVNVPIGRRRIPRRDPPFEPKTIARTPASSRK